jgi:hypothetical protein
MRVPWLLAGLVLVVLGLHWIGQGTGLFLWPSNPVMDHHLAWAVYGGLTAMAGVAVIAYARRRP